MSERFSDLTKLHSASPGRVQMGDWSIRFQSRTVWVNVALGLGLVLAMPELRELGLDSRWLALGTAALNIFLRAITTEPLVERTRPKRRERAR